MQIMLLQAARRYIEELELRRSRQVDSKIQLLQELSDMHARGQLQSQGLNDARRRFRALIEFFITQLQIVPIYMCMGQIPDSTYRRIMTLFDEYMPVQYFFEQMDVSLQHAITMLDYLNSYEHAIQYRKNSLVQSDLERVEQMRQQFAQIATQLRQKFGAAYTIAALRNRSVQALRAMLANNEHYEDSDKFLDAMYNKIFGIPELRTLLSDLKNLLGLVNVVDLPRDRAYFSLSLFDLAMLHEILVQQPRHPIVVVAGFYHCMGISRYLRQNGWQRIEKSIIHAKNHLLPQQEYNNGDEFLNAIDAALQQQEGKTQSYITQLNKQLLNSVIPVSCASILSLGKQLQ